MTKSVGGNTNRCEWPRSIVTTSGEAPQPSRADRPVDTSLVRGRTDFPLEGGLEAVLQEEVRPCLAQAERAFHEVQAEFLERGMGLLAASVAMDLAEIHLRAGRTAKVRELAEQMVPIFAAQDVHREALAALRLFVEAARADAAHLDLVADLRNYLRNAQADREHRFR
jgi:hypothetical protein